MKRLGLTSAALALGLGYATAAAAQTQAGGQQPVWLQDRRYSEGMGIRTGDLEMHPGLAAEFGYDSNYFLLAENEPAPRLSSTPAPALHLRITPSFSLATLGPQRREGEGGVVEPPKVAFRAGAAATYNELIGINSGDSSAFSDQRNVGAIGTLQITILPSRPLSVDVYGDFVRSVQPSNNPDFNFNRISGRFGGGITWAPGGGMFDWRFGYEFGVVHFEDTQFRSLSNDYNQVNTRGRWRFLPRTSLLYDASIVFLRYYDSPTPGQLSSDPVRARLGINGLITPAFALLAMGGWGVSFYKGAPNAQQFDGPLAQVELRWYMTPNPSLDASAATLTLSSLAIGYTRDFTNSYLGDYFTTNRGYLSLSYFFGGRFLVVANGGVNAVQYPTIYNFNDRSFVHDSFTAVQPDATLFGEYRLADSFGINATLRYTANITDVQIQNDRLKWTRFEAFAGVRWFL